MAPRAPYIRWLACLLLVAIGLKAAAQSEKKSRPIALKPTLRALADKRKLHIGACVNDLSLRDPQGSAVLAGQFNSVVAENAMKWRHLHPAAGTWNFDLADEIVKFADDHKMAVKGHALLWHDSIPDHLKELSADELRAAVHEHIRTVVGRYKGKIARWDVVNEGLGDDGELRKTLFLEKLGPEYIADAFRVAHEADPKAILVYNDYSCEGLGRKSNGLFELMKRMRGAGVPVHEVGLQMHLLNNDPPRLEDLVKNIQRLTALGLTVNISEMDVASGPLPGDDAQKMNRQAEIYGRVIAAAAATPGFSGVTFWGYSDRWTWVNSYVNRKAGKPQDDKPLLFDADFEPKPAFVAVQRALGGK